MVYEYKDGDLGKVLKFNKLIRQYVEEPSPVFCLGELSIRRLMEKKGNCYFIGPQRLSSWAPNINENNISSDNNTS